MFIQIYFFGFVMFPSLYRCVYIYEQLIFLQIQGFRQQSIEECPAGQLLYPQTKFPEQSLSESQSPCPTSHWLVAVQHSHSLFAGLHVSIIPKHT